MYLRAYKKTGNKRLLFYSRHFFIFVIVGLVSVIIARLQIGLQYGVPGFVYCTLGLLCYLHSKWFFKKYPEAIY